MFRRRVDFMEKPMLRVVWMSKDNTMRYRNSVKKFVGVRRNIYQLFTANLAKATFRRRSKRALCLINEVKKFTTGNTFVKLFFLEEACYYFCLKICSIIILIVK